jgi:predicted  nucleic acid-binding Zn-ribbon protein
MNNSQIELLVHYQDIDLMMKESEEVQKLGFHIEGCDKLQKAKNDLEKKLEPRYLNIYRRLSTRYKRPIVPVQDNICLGCFAKLPTMFGVRARDDQELYRCENCGRILYWVD